MITTMPTQPPIILARHPFVKAIAQSLRRRCGLNRHPDTDHRLIVATSGGRDSVALLRALEMLGRRRAWRLKLAVGHVQHHTRPEAEVDARFVANLAQQLGLPFLRADLDLSQPNGNLEARARQKRYQALAAMACDFDARLVVTAHHGDDQLETLLMRLLRGSSIRGLRCIAWQRKLLPDKPQTLLRPMLGVDRQQIDRFLADLNQPWRQDQTNTDRSRFRARLRHEVLPILHDLKNDVASKAVAVADHMRQAHALVETQVDRHARCRPNANGHTALDRRQARQMPEIILVSLLRRVLVDAGVAADGLGHRTVGPIIRSIRDDQGGQRTFALPHDLRVVVTRHEIRIEPKTDPPVPNTATGQPDRYLCHGTRGASPHIVSKS